MMKLSFLVVGAFSIFSFHTLSAQEVSVSKSGKNTFVKVVNEVTNEYRIGEKGSLILLEGLREARKLAIQHNIKNDDLAVPVADFYTMQKSVFDEFGDVGHQELNGTVEFVGHENQGFQVTVCFDSFFGNCGLGSVSFTSSQEIQNFINLFESNNLHNIARNLEE